MTQNEGEKKAIFSTFSSKHLELVGLTFENGFFISLFPKEEAKLGTMALSLPTEPLIGITRKAQKNTGGISIRDRSVGRKGRLTTVTVLGSRNEVFAKAFSEKVTQITGKMVYLSINFEEEQQELYNEAMDLLDKFLNEHLQA
ncbi:MAG: hypothetical protein GF308_01085 [Candidatus Heimdallarchaeota archaeon]|nr:hypothetical protein [Candidatus Heimdallarchaeota archaeon]